MRFPALRVRDLEGTEHVIPHGLSGGPHVLILAFQRWHQDLADMWKPHLEALAERHLGMEVWEVPSLSKGYRLFRSGIDGGMRAGIPDPDVRRHTLTTYTDLDALRAELDLPSLETIYVFLVDCEGAILWRAEGEPTQQLLDALEASVPEAC